jgi:glycosyltransferase involved in cell wall biosynthesis
MDQKEPKALQERWGVGDRHHRALAKFRLTHGRSPRLLAIGNIANNGYKNALILREHGIDCDVLCYDYYHVMGCPEWEHAQFDTHGMNFDAPNWSKVSMGGYARPTWFAQGRLGTCLDYLIARNANDPRAAELFAQLAVERDCGGAETPSSLFAVPSSVTEVGRIATSLAARFRTVFPDWEAAPDAQQIVQAYGNLFFDAPRLRRLFRHYDAVIGYATDGIFPLFCEKTPYITFEHGTIRAIPFEPHVNGQMCALTYRWANDVLISNCDNVVAAEKLRLDSYRFVPHAMLERPLARDEVASLRQRLVEKHGTDFIIFHPARQHWSARLDTAWEKGNDRLIRAFARFVRDVRPAALLIMVRWGQTAAESEKLVAELGIGSNVLWLEPQPMTTVENYVQVADVLADQFVIGAWGAIMPHGMMLGTPTLLKLDEDVHRWCFPEMPPVINTETDDQIFDALKLCTQPEYRAGIAKEAPEWYRRYHSIDVVAGRLMDSIFGSLAPTPEQSLRRELLETRAKITELSMETRSPRGGSGQASNRTAPGSLKGRIVAALDRLHVRRPFTYRVVMAIARPPVRALRAIIRAFN